jgi:hypothetical protein
VLISAGTILNGAIVKNDLANLRRIVNERLWGLTSVVRCMWMGAAASSHLTRTSPYIING